MMNAAPSVIEAEFHTDWTSCGLSHETPVNHDAHYALYLKASEVTLGMLQIMNGDQFLREINTMYVISHT